MRRFLAILGLAGGLFGFVPAHSGALCINHEMNCFSVPLLNAKINLLTVEGGRDGGPIIRTTGIALTAKPDDIRGAQCFNGACGPRYGITIDYGRRTIRIYLPDGCRQIGDGGRLGPCKDPT